MKKNRFFEKFQHKKDSELQEILQNKNSYTPEAIEATENILAYRKDNPTEPVEKENNNHQANKESKFIPEKEKYEFKYSLIYRTSILLGILLLVYVGYLGLKSGNNNSFLFIILAIIGIVFNYKLIKNRPEIVITKNGIWTNRLGEKHWNEIDTIVVENKSILKYLSRYINDNLFIYLIGDEKTSPSETIDLRGVSNKNKLRELSKYYIKNKDKLEFEKNTYVHRSTIYDTKNQLEQYKKSYPKIILITVILSFIFPFIDKLWDNGFTLIERFGYTNSVIISFFGFSLIYLLNYIFLKFKTKE